MRPHETDRIRIALMGPVTAAARRTVALGGERQRRVLSSLALAHGQVVPINRLIHDTWGEQPPRTAAAQLQTSIWMLRRALGAAGAPADAVRSYASGYELSRTGAEVDVDRFRALVREAEELRRRDIPEAAVRRLNDALDLRRGPALADAGSPALQAVATRLEEERLAALELRISLDIELGGHLQAIGELLELVTEHPFREGFHADLMLALYHAGRQSEALAVYRNARAVLAQELGIAPGPRLLALEQAILRHDFAVLGPSPAEPYRMPLAL
ncbi:AfsR/SARP family transcriptional regulator [Streptomyces sp. URMC 123]|uniref:AfsR/SARP family transcriptional regulator n=1 Tax=Streptomyces sp. URMC 123 TaxID=3423403 RepID=UPI003F1AC0AB